MDSLELFRGLMLMAVSDGHLNEQELRMLAARAVRWGITDTEFESALDDALKDDAEMTLPVDDAERLELLEELLRMMAVDGQLADMEKQLFAVAAASMDISDVQLNALLDRMLKGIE